MLKIVYIPLSWLYRLGVWVRHMLYDNRLLPSFSAEVPAICVGNLAVGGTGKTPMTAYLVQRLLDAGFRPAILSRGYKRTTHGFVLADCTSTVATIGDEAMQLHGTFPDVPLAVCESRVYGIKQLKRMAEPPDVIVLDDAMQHRALRCGLSILLTPYDHLYIDDHMLPWGTLRDLPSRALKADIVVVTKCPDSIRPIDMRVIDNRLHLPTYQHLFFAGIEYSPITQKGTPLVVCGIAKPQYLLEHVRQTCPQAEMMVFKDHYQYKPRDIDAILERAKHFDFVLTTEKDLQRLRTTDLEQRLTDKGKSLVTLPIRMRLCAAQEDFDKQIITYVRENSRK